MNLMQRGLRIHAKALKQAAGEPVIYFRGDALSASILAVVGQTIFEDVAGDGETRIETKTVDWLITPDELRKAVFRTEPQRGDQIRRNDFEVFDVVPGTSGKVWEWSDGHKTHYRIHSVRRNVPSF
ncbi:hypothetical protein K227x_62250 [Rubripirellula lacrimiformis]|uniref:Phage head-tail joining protein domain-containing protein n=1 Tax=Rubripirellula lacrimiformis TaxID=1930273 RepID=A0A517NKX2_9BACT|nr:hypothetical protein K227x_62250 [Rubripirellula lacrimiformis]